MFVKERFKLTHETVNELKSMTPQFGYNGFGEMLFYRTYSRIRKDGGQETWCDVVVRVIEGVFSIRKDHYARNMIPWIEHEWQQYAKDMAIAMFNMEWCPPGRGLWAMGTDFVYERGAMALYNCAYTDIDDDLPEAYAWIMDLLMHGVGVGFGPRRTNLKLHSLLNRETFTYVIADSRESWCESVAYLLRCYQDTSAHVPVFDYSLIRPKGAPIRGFGGIASGPEPLQELHKKIVERCELYIRHELDVVALKTDIANLIGCCVVAGNVRRSAEIACGSMSDECFIDLKDYDLFPARKEWGWMSNNSVMLENNDDFQRMSEIAKRVVKAGEPGYLNLMNFPYGRIGKNDNVPKDKAVGINPCGEIPLESRETCNVVETCPTNCETVDDWYKACEYATFYASTVSLLPTHQPSTNSVVARNRRIGVSIVDVTGWIHTNGVSKVTGWMRNGYNIVTQTNKWANGEAGVPEAIRKTTMKPGGTTPKMIGRQPGMSYPNFHHTLRRVRIQHGSPIYHVLLQAGVPHEPDVKSANTEVFEFPILQGPAKVSSEVSIWEQAFLLVLLQREWADNAVSNTLNFRPKWPVVAEFESAVIRETNDEIRVCTETDVFTYDYDDNRRIEIEEGFDGHPVVRVREYDPRHEEDVIEQVLSMIAPLTKSVSLLPFTTKGVYPQIPEEGISEEEYNRRVENLQPIDWSLFRNSDGQDEMYCQGDKCERP